MSHPPEKEQEPKLRLKRSGGALAIGAYVPAVARASFEAHGFPTAAVLSDWPEIIGPEFADITAPERLVWPRGQAREEANENPRSAFRRAGATLVVRVEGPRALEVQHMAAQIIERVNVYFGYRAVAELRLMQGPVHRDAQEQPAPEPQDEPAAPDVPVEDENLRAALSRLGARTAK